MTQALKMLQRGGTESTAYVDDVFSTYLYTGTSASQTITNGIDLSTNGGLVWTKVRNVADSHCLIDTARGVNKYLRTNATDAQDYAGALTDVITAFNSNGYTLGADANL